MDISTSSDSGGQAPPVDDQLDESQMPSSGPQLPGSSQAQTASQQLPSSQNLPGPLTSEGQQSSQGQTGSQQLPSSQNWPELLTSEAQHSSQSNKSDGSIGTYSLPERAKWKAFHDASAFTHHYHLPEVARNYLDGFLNLECEKQADLTFSKMLPSLAQQDIRLIRGYLTNEEKKQIRWSGLPSFEDSVGMDHENVDDLVFAWIALVTTDYPIQGRRNEKHVRKLCQLFPVTRKPERAWARAFELAFRRDEVESSDGHRASGNVLEKVLEFSQAYAPDTHLSPYTSVVGPSGVGKSFSVSQLALSHGVYVIYANFASVRSSGYPGRSEIANRIPEFDLHQSQWERRERLTLFWESVIQIGLLQVAACRELNVPPGAYFVLQSVPTYRGFQDEFATAVSELYDKKIKVWVEHGADRQSKKAEECEYLETKRLDLTGALVQWADGLTRNNDFHAQEKVLDLPEALLCFDEGRALLDMSSGSLQFMAWRQALRRRFPRSAKPQKSKEPGEKAVLFGLILDTTSRIADFSPPTRDDPTLNCGNAKTGRSGQDLFPPIFSIPTMDVCSIPDDRLFPEGTVKFPDGTANAVTQLLSFGRPLWGSTLQSYEVQPVENLLLLAETKIIGRGNSQQIALLSFRLNFYVNSHTLAEDLISNWLRWIVYINPTRDVMRTSQPSEPILAHLAAQMMSGPATRLAVLQSFMTSSFEGSINTGDLGEMTAAIILMFAFDEVLLGKQSRWPKAVGFADFIKSLLGETACASYAECIHTDQTMTAIWTKGYVFANHFQRLTQTPSQETLRKAFFRGCGLLLPTNFEGIDIIIPILYSDSVSCLAVSVKNRKSDTWSDGMKAETESSFEKISSKLNLSKPFFGLTMALRGVESGFDVVYPAESKVYLTRSQKKVKVDASSTASDAPAAAEDQLEPKHFNWKQSGPKHVVGLAMGLDEAVYPTINLCAGQHSEYSQAIPGLLRELLGCNAGITLPKDADRRYVSQLRAIEWDPTAAVTDEAPEI